ncbi:MAG: DUF2914 domain-containing protein [Desulfacinum sp.]|jgi:hypothetical protein|nr:DUF2914 domain-containing protein [Desulfacinum sp.]
MAPSRSHIGILSGLALLLLFAASEGLYAQEAPKAPAEAETREVMLHLARATMCEAVENLLPVNSAVVFPVSQGRVFCYTLFDVVSAPTQIFHRWFHRDELTTQIRLKLYPPRWATYSLIRLRETDKGPWRVEVTDAEGRILKVLRFSITD